MNYELRAFIDTHDMSDPFIDFCQIGISVHRDDGKSLVWRGQRIARDRNQKDYSSCYGPLTEAIASAVKEMLKDRTVLEFVGQV